VRTGTALLQGPAGPVRRLTPSLRGMRGTGSFIEWWGQEGPYSCTNQTVPSGGTARVAEYGWPCHGSSTASTPPMLPTPEPP
jgi:hypothetical protein